MGNVCDGEKVSPWGMLNSLIVVPLGACYYLSACSGDREDLMPKTATLQDVLGMSRELPRADRLRLISLLSEDLLGEMGWGEEPVDMLSLAGVGADVWDKIDVDAYLREERASWEA
jgi:hypothetical protein